MRKVRLIEEFTFRELVKELEIQCDTDGLEELVLMICERLTVEENLDVINIIKKINKSKIIERIEEVKANVSEEV